MKQQQRKFLSFKVTKEEENLVEELKRELGLRTTSALLSFLVKQEAKKILT